MLPQLLLALLLLALECLSFALCFFLRLPALELFQPLLFSRRRCLLFQLVPPLIISFLSFTLLFLLLRLALSFDFPLLFLLSSVEFLLFSSSVSLRLSPALRVLFRFRYLRFGCGCTG